ncbi:hypothetical protein [Actinoplanes palleronii]|uniref:Uncharacterized protein n=1 Tax=Actinoplanes palleronii TaxID=113570 RepID=A0ABQ4BPB4_9ACTN|nr:hypothetical protein [Actinoplanes palleronii]GIE72070.1 hypothetical protein Apa02nite_081780 [Actinoplanes palleronii]
MTLHSRALLGAVVAVAGYALFSSLQPDPPVSEEKSSWSVPVGYSILSTVDIDGGSVRLWEHHEGTAMCFVQEVVDQDGRHESAV